MSGEFAAVRNLSSLRAHLLTNLFVTVGAGYVGRCIPVRPCTAFYHFFRRADMRCDCTQVPEHQSHYR